MKIDDVARIGWEAEGLKRRMFPYGVGDKPHIAIGVTPKTYHEIETAAIMHRSAMVYRETGEWATLYGFPVKVIEQYNGDDTRGAWLMIELETEADT